MSEVFEVDPLSPETAGPALDAAAAAVADGFLAVFPTETVYGVAARPDDPAATAWLFEAKARPRGLTLPVLAATPAEAVALADAPPEAGPLAAAFWPGPLTIVLRRGEPSRAWDLGEESSTIGLRVPDLPLAAALLSRTGPLAVTSANRSGRPPATGREELIAVFGPSVAVYLVAAGVPAHDARGGGGPSTVVDLSDSPRARLRRAGAVTRTRIDAVLSTSGLSLEWVDFPP